MRKLIPLCCKVETHTLSSVHHMAIYIGNVKYEVQNALVSKVKCK